MPGISRRFQTNFDFRFPFVPTPGSTRGLRRPGWTERQPAPKVPWVHKWGPALAWSGRFPRASLLRTRASRQPRELPRSVVWHAVSESLRVFIALENVPQDATFQAMLTQVVGIWGRGCLSSIQLKPRFWCTERCLRSGDLSPPLFFEWLVTYLTQSLGLETQRSGCPQREVPALTLPSCLTRFVGGKGLPLLESASWKGSDW